MFFSALYILPEAKYIAVLLLKPIPRSINPTSKGVSGHFPFILIAPGLITRPGLVNFPLQPFSLAASNSFFSLSPPSNTQQEKATIS